MEKKRGSTGLEFLLIASFLKKVSNAIKIRWKKCQEIAGNFLKS